MYGWMCAFMLKRGFESRRSIRQLYHFMVKADIYFLFFFTLIDFSHQTDIIKIFLGSFDVIYRSYRHLNIREISGKSKNDSSIL